jgi:hypothetical protein
MILIITANDLALTNKEDISEFTINDLKMTPYRIAEKVDRVIYLDATFEDSESDLIEEMMRNNKEQIKILK